MEPRYIVCWLSIYFGISSSLLHVVLIDLMVRFCCATPVDPVVGTTPEFTIISIKVRSTWRYLRSSSIFESSIVSSISVGGRLGWRHSYPERVEENTTQEGEKASRHEGRNLAGVKWESLDSYSVLLDGRSVGWVLYGEKNILVVGATLGPLSEEVVGESVDSEAASFLLRMHEGRSSSLTLQNFPLLSMM